MARTQPVGTRVTWKSGYVRVKTAEGQRKWSFEHRVVWESIHGPLPDGWKIHHIDENRANNAPENLVACESNSAHHRTYHHEQHVQRGRTMGLGCKGVPKSPEHRAKISAALVGKTKSSDHRAKISASLKGNPLSPERVANMRGRTMPPEQRAKIAESMRKRWESPDYQRAVSEGLRRERHDRATIKLKDPD